MARIRTIKPEFFKHEGLFDAEKETGLPLRIAYAGLWTCCDREGRFVWRPRALKTDVLPYDDVDFSRVLDALATRGFIVRYASGGREFGVVPGFSEHQVVNARESASKIPPPPQVSEKDEDLTRGPRVSDASGTGYDLARGEGKGREGELEGKGVSSSSVAGGAIPEVIDDSPDGLFDRVLQASGRNRGNLTAYWMPPAGTAHVWKWVTELGLTPDQVVEVARNASARFETPPNGPKALDGAMKIFAGTLQADAMQPIKGARNDNRSSTFQPSNGGRPGYGSGIDTMLRGFQSAADRRSGGIGGDFGSD